MLPQHTEVVFPQSTPLKLSEVKAYLMQATGIAQRILRNTIDLANDMRAQDEIANDIKQWCGSLNVLLEQVKADINQIQPAGWNPLSYGQSLIQTAHFILEHFYHFIFKMYGDLHQAGLLEPKEVGQRKEIFNSLKSMEEKIDGLLALGAGMGFASALTPCHVEKESEQLEQMLEISPHTYQLSRHRTFITSKPMQYFVSECMRLLQDAQKKFENLEIDYWGLSKISYLAKPVITSSIREIQAMLAALPNFGQKEAIATTAPPVLTAFGSASTSQHAPPKDGWPTFKHLPSLVAF